MENSERGKRGARAGGSNHGGGREKRNTESLLSVSTETKWGNQVSAGNGQLVLYS